jgi:hypothetical protein
VAAVLVVFFARAGAAADPSVLLGLDDIDLKISSESALKIPSILAEFLDIPLMKCSYHPHLPLAGERTCG